MKRRPWMPLASLIVLMLPSLGRAQVVITLRIPNEPDRAMTEKVSASESDIHRLLGRASSRELVSRIPERRMKLRFTAPAWSSLGSAERATVLARLRLLWGEDLSVEEAGRPLEVAANPGLAPVHRRPDLDARFAQMQALLNGSSRKAFDGGEGIGSVGIAQGASPWGPQRLHFSAATVRKSEPGSGRHEAAILNAAKASGVDPALLRAVVAVKSRFQADMRARDHYGLMGLSAGIGKAYGHDKEALLDPAVNLAVGADLLARLLKQFQGDLSRALAAYQVGPRAVLESGGIPNEKPVQDFLAAFQRAYRAGPRKPPVAPVPVRDKSLRAQLREASQGRLLAAAEAQGCGPRPLAVYRALIEEIARKFGMDAKLMEAMVMKENPWGDPCRRNRDSGAEGLGQLMPRTAKALGVNDRTDPRQNLDGMARHLKWLLRYFGGDRVLAVAGYNAGHVPVEKAGRVPRIRETMNYTKDVFDNYADLGGEKVDVQSRMPASSAKKSR